MKKMKSDLRQDEQFSTVFCVRSVRQGQSKGDAPFVEFRFSDKSGTINGYLWTSLQEAVETVKENSFAVVEGALRTREKSLIVKIHRIRRAEHDEVDYSDFGIVTPVGIEPLREQLAQLIGNIRDEHCARLIKSFTGDKEFMRVFEAAPGGKRLHHPYIGGLLEHTVAAMTHAESVAGIYSAINRDVLVTGAFFHDVGKVVELCAFPSRNYTDEGNLHGHIVIGCCMVQDAITRLEGFPELLRRHVIHIIISHHGAREKGSPVPPLTAEALAMSAIDGLDAGVNRIQIEMLKTGGAWSPFDEVLKKRFYLNRYESWYARLAA